MVIKVASLTQIQRGQLQRPGFAHANAEDKTLRSYDLMTKTV